MDATQFEKLEATLHRYKKLKHEQDVLNEHLRRRRQFCSGNLNVCDSGYGLNLPHESVEPMRQVIIREMERRVEEIKCELDSLNVSEPEPEPVLF